VVVSLIRIPLTQLIRPRGCWSTSNSQAGLDVYRAFLRRGTAERSGGLTGEPRVRVHIIARWVLWSDQVERCLNPTCCGSISHDCSAPRAFNLGFNSFSPSRPQRVPDDPPTSLAGCPTFSSIGLFTIRRVHQFLWWNHTYIPSLSVIGGDRIPRTFSLLISTAFDQSHSNNRSHRWWHSQSCNLCSLLH